VIPARTVPKTGATGVQVGTYVQVVFTEPVRKIPGNVVLKDARGQPVAVRLSGVLRFGGVIEDLSASPDAAITSLTVQPLSGLEYGATYTLELADGIQDLDTTPQSLVPYQTSFTTFTPESLSKNPGSFGSPGIVILGERAYLVQNDFYSGTLRVFETTDPVEPLEIPNSESDSRDPRYTVSYRPVDLVGESDSPLTGGRVVAVTTGPTAQSKPSNVWLLNVSDDAQTQWIGAVSLTSSAADGFVNRTFQFRDALRYRNASLEMARAFDERWISSGRYRDREAFSGNADVQALANMAATFRDAASMRVVPFDMATVGRLLLAAASPMLPLIIGRYPVLKILANMLAGE
jgi:hypothetical protein